MLSSSSRKEPLDGIIRAFKRCLAAPLRVVEVTGAVFRNQGGVDIEAQSRVPRKAGTSLPNLLAAAGPARGVSGKEVWGTLTGSTHSRPACPSKRYSGWKLATWITPSRPKSGHGVLDHAEEVVEALEVGEHG